MIVTKDQIALLIALYERNPDGSLLDLMQAQAALAKPTKSALRQTLDQCIAKGLAVRSGYDVRETLHSGERRRVTLLDITELGKHYVKPYIRAKQATLKDVLFE